MKLFRKSFVLGFFALAAIVTGSFVFSESVRPTASESLKKYEVHSNYVEFNDVNSLEEFADLIIIGSPAKPFEEDNPVVTYNKEGRYEDFYTISDVKVKKVLKGEYSKDTVPVLQSAAITTSLSGKEKIFMISDDFSVMEKNKKYLLFLKKTDNNNYSIISVNQGKFNIDDQDKNEKELSSHNEQYGKLKKEVIEQYKGKF